MLKIVTSRRLMLLSLLACIIGSVNIAYATVTLRIGWPTADNKNIDPYAIMAHDFANQLDKMAPGEFNVKFFPNHQLGSEVQMVQQMEVGALDMGVITGAKIATIIPAFKVNDLPFIYSSQQQAQKVLDGKVGKKLLKDLEKKNIIGLGFAVAGFRQVINNVRPVSMPSDLNSLKIRVQPNDLFIATFKALGANPVPMDWNDTFVAVQQHTIDGLEIPLAVIYANKYPEVTKYLSLTNHAFNSMPLIISKITYQQMSSKQQHIVRKAAHVALKKQHKTVADNNKKLVKMLKKAGMKVNKVKDISAFQKRVKPIYQQYKSNIGQNLVNEALKETAGND